MIRGIWRILPPNPQNGGTFVAHYFSVSLIKFYSIARGIRLIFTKENSSLKKIPPFWGLGGRITQNNTIINNLITKQPPHQKIKSHRSQLPQHQAIHVRLDARRNA